MKLYQNYAEFKADDRKLREEGKTLSDQYLTHVKSAVQFFHTTGNHNIQIINDVLDTASAMRLQRNRVIDWLEGLLGHTVEKLDGGKFGFGKKAEGVEYEDIVSNAPEHFEQYPDWYAFKKESDPESFDAKRTVQLVIKKLMKASKDLSEHEYKQLAVQLETFAKGIETQPIVQDEPVDHAMADNVIEDDEAAPEAVEGAVNAGIFEAQPVAA